MESHEFVTLCFMCIARILIFNSRVDSGDSAVCAWFCSLTIRKLNASFLVPFGFNLCPFRYISSERERNGAQPESCRNKFNETKESKTALTFCYYERICCVYVCVFTSFLSFRCGINACATTRHMHKIMSIVSNTAIHNQQSSRKHNLKKKPIVKSTKRYQIPFSNESN